MSQQGPGGFGGGQGGYGGPPPGGPGAWGPPGGGVPGGYGAPQAGPPGAPGWPPAPGGAGAPPPGNKTNPALWIGLGCGALLLIAIAGGIGFYFMARSAAKSVSAAAGAFSVAVEAAVDAGVLIPSDAGGAPALPPGAMEQGGALCIQAADCCKAVVTKTGGHPAASAACENLRSNTPALACQQALETYKKMAPLMGAACP